MNNWTKGERAQAIRDTEEMVMKDSHFEIVAAYNEVAIELACQRNRVLAALKIGRFYTQAYGELAQEIGHPCCTVPEDLLVIDAAIAACKEV